jgi:transcriptional regulator with XRE-family HTH domain
MFIRDKLKASGLQQKEAAERAGIPYSSFRRYLQGERAMTVGDFLSLLDVFDVPPGHAITEVRRLEPETKRS